MMLETSPVAPPVVELGRLAGWRPLPLVGARGAPARPGPARTAWAHPPVVPTPGAGDARARGATASTVRYGATVAVRDVDLAVGPAARWSR